MEYTVNSLSKLAGISTRTLRYYDEIGLLKPGRISSSGYRIYGQEEIDLLQQILFYKELELPLEKIKLIINSKNFDCKEALYKHKKTLLQKQKQIELLLNNVEKTLQSLEGGIEMANKEKFEGFKKDKIKQNEEKYGKEIREKYGEDKVQENYNKFTKLTKKEWEEAEELSIQINKILKEAIKTQDSTSDLAYQVVKLHKRWLSYFGNYAEQAHLALGQMYVDDLRFTEYYEKNVGRGAAKFLRDSIASYYNAKFDETTWQWKTRN